ncbi:hypothetical protein [Ornithinibacillus californiensis]|uniref:hypothetical protein n=1 Tax=Ornithinibacillus californiensis TaxID=161536 RepID=UPI0012EE74B0|nr:hypothetical protein [Ornithinibacillus californiensis]
MKMKKKLLLLTISLAITMIVASFVPSITATESNRTVNKEDVMSKINYDNFGLQVIGNFDLEIENKGLNIAKNVHSSKSLFPGKTDGIVVAQEKVAEVFQDKNKQSIKSALTSGKTFFLLGQEMTSQKLADFLDYDINLEEDIKNLEEFESVDQAIYVTSNKSGKLTFGVIQNSPTASKESFKEAIVLEAWLKRGNENRRGDVGEKKGVFEEHARTYFFTPDEASANIYPNIGSGWYVSFGPSEYVWNTDHGHLFERKRGYYLKPSIDQDRYNDWTALTMYMEAVPDGTGDSVSEIDIYSNTSYSDTNSGIGRYGPRSDPGSNSLSYQIGVNSDGTVGFSASWSINSSDLSVLNNSCTSCGRVDLTLDYAVGSTYSNNTSTHEPAFSYTNPQGASYSDMINRRSVTFRGWGYVGKDYAPYYDTVTSPLYGTDVKIY